MPHKTKKIIRLFAVIFLLLGAVAWWLFYFPVEPEVICRVVSDDAQFVSRHICPAERFDLLADSQVVSNLLARLGEDGDDLRESLENSGTRWLIDHIGAKYIVTSVVLDGDSRLENFVFGAWIGAYAPLLSWGVFDQYLKDFRILEQQGYKIWVYTDKNMQGYYISLAIYRGLMVGAYSQNPVGVIAPLDRLSQKKMPASLADKLLRSANRSAADVYVSYLVLPPLCGGGLLDIYGEVNEISDSRLTSKIVFSPDAAASSFIHLLGLDLPPPEPYVPANILGEAPACILTMPVATLELMTTAFVGRIEPTVKRVLHSCRRESLTIFVSGGKYCSRLMGMKIPALGFVMTLLSNKGSGVIAGLVQALNRSWHWQANTVRSPVDMDVFVLKSHTSPLRNLRQSERPAFAITQQHLLGLSSLAVTRRILKSHKKAPWKNLATAATCYGWCDMAETKAVLHRGLAGYTLASMLSHTRKTKRYDSDAMKKAIDMLGLFDELYFRIIPQKNHNLSLELELTY